MPNRLIKESITTSEDIDLLSSGAEILFYRLMVKADDFGIYYGNAKLIRSNCFPLRVDDVPTGSIEIWLNELVRAGLIMRYRAQDGRIYLKFVKWEKHQQIRSKKSKFPQFDDSCAKIPEDDINCIQMISDDIRKNQMIADAPVIQSNPIQSEYEYINESNTTPAPPDDSLTHENDNDSSEKTYEELVSEWGNKVLFNMERKWDAEGIVKLAELKGINRTDLQAYVKKTMKERKKA